MEEKIFKAVLVGVNYNKMPYDIDVSMDELHALASACKIEVVDMLIQNMDSPSRTTYIGSGKIEELKLLISGCDVNLVIVNEELSPSQISTLEAMLEIEIVDRTYLILDIFASRANTKEAKLQVEIARLRYLLPRLIGLNEGIYSQQGGSGFRGSGEKKLETDRRKIKRELAQKSLELEEAVLQRKVQRSKRDKSSLPVVALVGYTNSGKSTLMNRLLAIHNKEEKKVFVKDMLFATLETSTRSIEFEDKKSILLTDTVGFVDQLPHHLIKAFRSTLEEVCEADLLIHVIDVANKNYEKQIEVTNAVLKEIGVKEIPMLYVYNKMDICENVVLNNQEHAIFISTLKDDNLNSLISKIKEMLFKDFNIVDLKIPYDKSNIYSYLKEKVHILSEQNIEDGYLIQVELSSNDKNKYQEYVI